LPDRKKTFYIGNYGEAFSYSDDWILNRPIIKDGVEVIRLHAERDDDGNPIGFTPEAAFADLKKYTPRGLVQLLVIPNSLVGNLPFEDLRAAKLRDLTSQGATFDIADSPPPSFQWPQHTFQVFTRKPFHLYQLYVESGNRRFILTTGLRLQPGNDVFQGESTAPDIVSSLGDYFGSLNQTGYAQPKARESDLSYPNYSEYFKRVLLTTLPLLIIGILLFIIPWGNNFTKPLAGAAVCAFLAGLAGHAVGGYAALSAMHSHPRYFVLPGLVSWSCVISLPIFIFVGSLYKPAYWRWISVILALVSSWILAGLASGISWLNTLHSSTPKADFALFLYFVGLCFGGNLGLTCFSPRYKFPLGKIAC
jgi:hypothetical protein